MEKEIQWLQSRIDKLHEPGFDLEAWKSGTIVVIAKLFGDKSPKIDQISAIRYEQSSWSLRDAKGSGTMIEGNIRRAEEILRVAMEELQQFGAAGDAPGTPALRELIVQALESELKVAQFRAVAELIRSDETPEVKRKKLIGLLNGYGHDTVPNMLATILLSDPVVKSL
jgi:hypothetical protein